MDYKQTVDYLYSCLPSLDKKGWSAYKPGLSRVNALLKLLDNPQDSFKIIHVAGTNGKGSVSHMLASVLQESGLKVGLFTSPHLKDFRERIKVNGKEVNKKKVIDFVGDFKVPSKDISPSFFEYTFALAADHFKESEVDVAVIETGLGGRLDCTNVVNPILSVITNISLDHEQFLGDTLQKVAGEKAGIIKENTPVVIGRQQDEVQEVYNQAVKKQNARLHLSDAETETYKCELQGDYQIENQRTVLKCIEVLKSLHFLILPEHVQKGLQSITLNTGLKGRWQLLSHNPKIICDVGHNIDGVKQIMKQLSNESYSGVSVVWGMSEDKKITEILSLLPIEYNYYWCAAENPRSLNAAELRMKGSSLKLFGKDYSSVYSAYQHAKSELKEGEILFVGGSVFVVAEVI
ncbi:MAG: dihydrofolate synthase/folylpolyglutamate synthase [Glaciecola sp.]|jgi:dihydrofolate synthase/folylpolyglutamate synthase